MAYGVDQFCRQFDGKEVSSLKLAQMILPLDDFTDMHVGVIAYNNCDWTISDSDCRRILMKIANDCKWATFLRIGGTITDNCGQWYMWAQFGNN